MDALLASFVAAALAEFGDKTQLLVIAIAARYRRAGAILAGVAVAALANNFIAAFGGTLVNGMITLRAISLLMAVALLFAGIAALIPQRSPAGMGAGWRTGAFVTTAACFFLLEFGDKTQFLTFAIAAQYDSLVLAAVGATAGIVIANAPAAFLAERSRDLLRLKPLRQGIAAIFIFIGFIVAVSALRLV